MFTFLKRSALVVLTLLAVAQLFLSARTNRPVDPARKISVVLPIDPAVSSTFGRSCNDCHSQRTRWPVVAAASKEELKRPSLKMTREEGCEPPKKLEYTPGQPIEDLCAAPVRKVNGPEI